MIKTIADIIEGLNKWNKDALVYKTGFRTFSLTYKQLYRNVHKTSTLLDGLGLKKGDKIILWGYNSPSWGTVFLSAALRGVVIVPIDQMASVDFVQKIQFEVNAQVIFHSEYKIPPTLGIKNLVLEYLDSYIEKIQEPKIFPPTVNEDDILEIVYTSGTTGNPKGVILTHKNLISNIVAIKKHVNISSDQTFLSVLPLSHLFEQTPGFLTPMSSGCTIIYMKGLRPNLIFKTLAEVQVTNIILVPRLLQLFTDGILREVEAEHKTKFFKWFLNIQVRKSFKKVLFRRIHKKFGTSFRYFIVGGAPLPVELESFWNQIGFTVIQGYGLTECSPVLTANSLQKQILGSVGTPVSGVQLKIEIDGEIYAKGNNITQGYFLNKKETSQLFENGWMKTGDIGWINNEGYLILKGRKKDVIVTSSGINVYPNDIEEILLKNKDVKDVCVLGLPSKYGEQIHAEILLKNKTDIKNLITQTNKKLNESQQITSYGICTKDDFPRTTTMKIQKHFVLMDIQKRKKTLATSFTSQNQPKLYQVLAKISQVELSRVKPDSKLSLDLQMNSVNRIELVSILEQEFSVDINEEEITADTTVGMLEKMVRERSRFLEKNIFRRWLLWDSVRGLRMVFNLLITDNQVRLFCKRTVIGKENLKNLKEPAIFIANHVGYFDTPNILMSLPFHIRNRIAAAAWKEYFEIPKHQIVKKLLYNFYYQYASLFSNIYLFPKKKGFKKSLEYTGELLDKKWNILFFPEGEHSKSGELQPFRPGIGWIVKEMRVPIVPIKHSGLENIMAGDKPQIPKFGKVTVTIGRPVTLDYTKSIPEIINELQKILQNM